MLNKDIREFLGADIAIHLPIHAMPFLQLQYAIKPVFVFLLKCAEWKEIIVEPFQIT